MVTVRLPSMLRDAGPAELTVAEPVTTLGQLIDAIDRLRPGFRHQVDDALFNFAVNDRMVLHRVADHPVASGDVVEIVPTIAGG